jgi:kynurenine formamidase
MYVKLSHNLKVGGVGWPGNPKLSFTQQTSIKNGDIANTFDLHLFNHFGTHFDAPNHFWDPGLKIAQLPIETFVYEKPLLLEIPKDFAELVTSKDLIPYADKIAKADLLMIRSGNVTKRDSDPARFVNEGVGFSCDAAKYVMDNFKLKAIAMDWLSLASYTNTEDGNEAHRILFGKCHDHYTCAIEDCTFEPIRGKEVKKVFALPLIVEGVDSGPVTIIAEI